MPEKVSKSKFRYNTKKDALLLESRKVGFEEIIEAISKGGIVDIVQHRNLSKYPSQKIMYVKHLEKIYTVPYVLEEDGTLFLKTLFPSRKATKKYLICE